MSSVSSLLLYNANVLTQDSGQPRAGLVLARGGHILFVGSNADRDGLRGPNVREVDCQGMTLVPGFNDAHLHFMALASSLLALDCSLRSALSIVALQRAIRERAAQTEPGQWVRAWGYDESELAEGRHPTRHDLDAAAPRHPVRLDHRSGHACVLNTLAMTLVSIFAQTPDPPQGVILRDASGEPTGVLLEMNDYVSRRMGEHRAVPPQALEAAGRLLLSHGITSFTDASVGNTILRFEAFLRMSLEGRLKPRATVMPGAEHLGEFVDRGLYYGSGGAGARVGAAKIMLTTTTGALYPPPEELARVVHDVQRQGFPVAIHAVEAAAVAAAIEALEQAGEEGRRLRHRIEHCSECPPGLLPRLATSGAVVVTQPGFLYHSGERYLRDVPHQVQSFLYRVRSWLEAGVPVAFSSDAPVAPPGPLEAICAAVTRRSAAGNVVVGNEAIDAATALWLHTVGGAHAEAQEAVKGSIQPGKLADFALLDADPTAAEPGAIRDIRVRMTVIGGEVAWEG